MIQSGNGDQNRVFYLDIARRNDGIDLWIKRGSCIERIFHQQPSSFYLAYRDPSRYLDIIEGVSDQYPCKACTFRTIYGEEKGWQISAGRETAELIEIESRFMSRLYNVDIRPEQRFSAEHRIGIGGWEGSDRFDVSQDLPITRMEITCGANPHRSDHLITVVAEFEGRRWVLEGSNRSILDDLLDIIGMYDPDLILFPDYDAWSGRLCAWAEQWKIQNTLSRSGKFRSLDARSYVSYGRMEHRIGAKVPEGRIIVDTKQSFMYREGDIRGIMLASRLSGLSPNLACRLTPGTLISSYEVYEALATGMVVPFRKSDAEAVRNCSEVRLDYRGGLILQPPPGVYDDVHQVDFTSFYPSIIVRYNLSPETLNDQSRTGFLSRVLKPVVDLRVHTKKMKNTDPSYAGVDGILKWMLVTCFGYTGYKNARFGRIEVHERITTKATELLTECMQFAERKGITVLHAITDCLFVQGENIGNFAREIESLTGISTETDLFDWVVFLPQSDGSGSSVHYYGRLSSGKMKMRGLAARRGDMPGYVKEMQKEMLDILMTCRKTSELQQHRTRVEDLYHRYRDQIPYADPESFIIKRRIGRESYRKRCIADSVVKMYHGNGIELLPGMSASYVVRDEKRWEVEPSWNITRVDLDYYRRLVDKAWEEIEFVFRDTIDQKKV